MHKSPPCENHVVNAAEVHCRNRVSATMPRSELPSRYIRFMHYEKPHSEEIERAEDRE